MVFGRLKYGSKVHETDTFEKLDTLTHVVDYEASSTTAEGAKCRGSIYVRGIKSDPKGEYDTFKFILEKSVDFNEVDSRLFLKAYYEAFKTRMSKVEVRPLKPITSKAKKPKKEKTPKDKA